MPYSVAARNEAHRDAVASHLKRLGVDAYTAQAAASGLSGKLAKALAAQLNAHAVATVRRLLETEPKVAP